MGVCVCEHVCLHLCVCLYLHLWVETQGESRLMRMQFSGSCRAESLEECRSAVLRLKEYLPVSSQGGAPPPLSYSPAPNQTPTETTTLHQQVAPSATQDFSKNDSIKLNLMLLTLFWEYCVGCLYTYFIFTHFNQFTNEIIMKCIISVQQSIQDYNLYSYHKMV